MEKSLRSAKKCGRPSVANNKRSDDDMGTAVARRAHKASWVGLAGLQYLCLTCSESYDRATDRLASAEWFLTQLAKVGLPFPLSLSKQTDNKWKLDYSYYKQYVVNHVFGVGVGEGISFAETLVVTLVICFKLNFFGNLSPWPFPSSFYWRDKMTFPGTERQRHRKAGQKGGTKRHFPGTEWQRDRKAGQNVWDRRAGTERLGSSY